MMHCGFECYVIGGPYIAENPNCPYHGTEAQERERMQGQRDEQIKEILIQCWHREISADDAHEAIMDLLAD